MRDTRIFQAKFSGLIMTVLGKEQTIGWEGDMTMYQASSSPARWEADPALKPTWKASSPRELAKILQESFVMRMTKWVELKPEPPLLPATEQRANVIPIDLGRRA